jgi:hypothetical protein
MSAFTKPPNDAGNPGAPKPEAQPAKPSTQQKPAGPPVIVTRTIDVGPAAKPVGAARPAAPPMGASSTAPKPAAAPPAAQVAPVVPAKTVRMEQPPKSVRPAAPAMGEDPSSSIADTFERLLSSDVERGFDAIERKSDPGFVRDGVAQTDLAEVRSLFAQLATNHVRPVRDFLMDLRWGEATIEWVDVCTPSLKSLRRAAEKLELTEMCSALDAFSAALAGAKDAGTRTIESYARAAILSAHESLAQLMPQAFALDLDQTQRESAILQSLLLQVPDVKKVTIDKLYAAGLTTLQAMLLANPGDIAATTGIDETVAKRIVARFRDYHAQVQAGVPDATRAAERARIAELTAKLRKEHEAFEAASQGWTRESAEQKRQLRDKRARTLLDIEVVLARLGEVERCKEIERLPFEKKVAHLEAFLEEARDKYLAQP